ncbi:MAG TPA: hypothetical protein VMF69_22245 [Gemmataceae bacterium]|nr:hypothetical protein [Gemmataceae bacterium]
MNALPKKEPRLAARFLEQTLLVNLGVHIAALIGTSLLLLPALPGGNSASDAERVGYLAAHPWLWRLGWLPWQAAALLNVLTGLALWRTAWVPRLPAAAVLMFTLLAVAPDQAGQFLWVTRGLDLAADAERSGDLRFYLAFEKQAYQAVVVWAGTLYLCMALSWSWCFAAAGTWKRSLTVLSLLAWSLLAIGSAGLLLPEELRPGPLLVGASSAVGLTLLLFWLALVAEQVLRRARPDAKHGRLAPWRHPWRGLAGRTLEMLGNSRLLRAYCEWLPPLAFLSDITDVIYVNYLVDADRLEPFVADGLDLQRLGRGGRYALFTHLTCRHGHFGPRLLGPLRRLLPSPVHSNWRIYVVDPHTGLRGVYFVTNAIASTPHALAARLLSEGMPMHVFRRAAVQVGDDRACRVLLDPGQGSAPDLEAILRPSDAVLPGPPWSECFESHASFLAYCVTQERAFSSQPWYERITRQEIAVRIPLESCEPMNGEVRSHVAAAYVGDAAPLCFRVGRVAFCFEREEHDQHVRESIALRFGVVQACLSLPPVRRAVPLSRKRLSTCAGGPS